MIIISKGIGIFAIIIPFVFEWLFGVFIDLYDIKLPSKFIQPVSFFISGFIIWFLGKYVNKSSSQTHSLFTLKFEYWGIIFAIIGLVMLSGGG